MKKAIKFLVTVFICAMLSVKLHAQSTVFNNSISNSEIVQKLLDAEFDSSVNYIKWRPVAGEKIEYRAEGGDGFLYSAIDTALSFKHFDKTKKLIIFHTTSLSIFKDLIIKAHSCSNCGVTVGYVELERVDSVWLLRDFKKNIGNHGSFGQNNYKVEGRTTIKGYILKFDELKRNVESDLVLTTFYKNGARMVQIPSGENNEMIVGKDKKGYFEYTSNLLWKKDGSLRIVKKGYSIHKKTGKKANIYNIITLQFDSYF